MTAANAAISPSHRGLRNLRPTPMFDLQRLVEQFEPYDAEHSPDGLIDIASSINSLMEDEVLEYSSKYILPTAQSSLQYGSTAGSPKLLSSIAQYVNTYFSPSMPVEPPEIMVTNGVSSLLNILAFNMCDAGEAIMYPVPEYGMFSPDLSSQNGINVVEVVMEGVDDRFAAKGAAPLIKLFKAAVEKAARRGIKVKALIVSNPCNPLGRCYSRSTLVAMMRFCAKEKLHFISDEIYAMSAFARSSATFKPSGELDVFTSVLSLQQSEGVCPANIYCLSGSSKDFGMGGLRLGFMVTRNPLMFKAVRKLGCFTWVSSFADAFFHNFLSDTTHLSRFFDLYQQRLQLAHLHTTEFLSAHDIAYDPSNAGLYLWIDLSPWLRFFQPAEGRSAEIQLTYHLIRKGVYLEPGAAFYSPTPGHFRLAYAVQNREVTTVALNRLVTALETLKADSEHEPRNVSISISSRVLDDEKLVEREKFDRKLSRAPLRKALNAMNCFV